MAVRWRWQESHGGCMHPVARALHLADLEYQQHHVVQGIGGSLEVEEQRLSRRG
ncbi:unnamed protein product [Urochloa humidicola]